MWRVAWHVTCREWRGVERLAGAESRIGPPSALKIEIFCFSGGRPTTAASRDHDPCATNPEGGWANQRCRPCRPALKIEIFCFSGGRPTTAAVAITILVQM